MSDAPNSSSVARYVRDILAGLRAVNEAVDSSPYDTDDVGDVLRGLLGCARMLTDLPVTTRKESTGISRDSIRVLLERYPRIFAAALVQISTADLESRTAIEKDLRRQAISLGMTVDSILASSTFRPRHDGNE